MAAPVVSLTETVADDLREKILGGDLEPGAKLPSETELVNQYGYSRNTVRNALRRLISEGLVVSHQGLGYHVRAIRPLPFVASAAERNIRTDLSPADAWSVQVRELGRVPREDIEVATVEPPRDVAEALSIDPGAYAVVRRRTRYVDGEPMTLADSYYPEALVRGTTICLPGDVLPGTYAVLEDMGLGWVRSRDVVRSRMPTQAEAARLGGLAPGTTVLDKRRTSWTADGTPIRLLVEVLPGDRNEIIYNLEERA